MSGTPQDPSDSRYDWLYGGGQRPSGPGRPSDQGSPDDPTRPVGQPAGHGGGYAGGGHEGGYHEGGYGGGHGGYPPGPPPQATRPMPQGYPPQGQAPPPWPPQQPPGQQPPGPPPHAPPGYGYPPPRRSRRRFRFGRSVLVLLLAYLVFLVAVPFLAWSQVEKVDFAPDDERPADAPGHTFLVVGSDSREGLTEKQQKELGTGGPSGGQRTDTIMLLHVPSNGLPPALVSVPRDSYVPIPGHGKNKINAAFSYGGPKLLAETLENTTGLRIDSYVEIGFGGFVGMVDSVGGVDMCIPEAIQDEKARLDLDAGCQTLEGKQALGYVRARYFDPRGDLGRVERQQKFMAALADKAVSPGTVLNPIRYTGLAFATGDALTAGKGTSMFDMVTFAFAMRTVSSGQGQSLTVPIGDSGYASPVGSAVLWDSDEALELFGVLEEDKPIPPSLLPEEGE